MKNILHVSLSEQPSVSCEYSLNVRVKASQNAFNLGRNVPRHCEALVHNIILLGLLCLSGKGRCQILFCGFFPPNDYPVPPPLGRFFCLKIWRNWLLKAKSGLKSRFRRFRVLIPPISDWKVLKTFLTPSLNSCYRITISGYCILLSFPFSFQCGVSSATSFWWHFLEPCYNFALRLPDMSANCGWRLKYEDAARLSHSSDFSLCRSNPGDPVALQAFLPSDNTKVNRKYKWSWWPCHFVYLYSLLCSQKKIVMK